MMSRDCIIDKNARIGKNVVIANSEVRALNQFTWNILFYQ